MEHTITAPTDGILRQLDVTIGQQVEVGAVLALVETDDTQTDDTEGEQP